MEFHPRLNLSNLRIKESRIILGSFPTWSLTDCDPEKDETSEQKKLERIKNGDIPFYYGSSINRFWNWYKIYVDESISIEDIISIKASLVKKSIGITDVIISCSRKNRSALDKHLTKRTYNHQFFGYPKRDETIKILCTSKGVMNEMLLNNKFFKTHTELKLNVEKSDFFQKQILHKVNGDISLLRNPLYRIIDVESGGSIECMSIPSPGSPYRRLKDFGYSPNDADLFLNSYLSHVFNWFSS